MIIIGAVILIFTGRPILYRQKRTGLYGQTFTLLKFRTMTVQADKVKNKLSPLNEANGPTFKIYNDPRYTSVGKFLSHTGLDELPQLFNILRGDMSLIGPRPLPVQEASKLKKWHLQRHIVKPGIVSPWIFEGYHNSSFDKWMRSDVAYAKNKNVLTDSLLMVKTAHFFILLVGKEIKLFFK